MRAISWLGGLLLLIVIGAATGAVALTHRQQAPDRPSLIAARAAADTITLRRIILAKDLRPSPSPAPSALPAAAPARPQPPAMQPSIAIGSTQQALINSDRAGRGLGGLSWSSCLYNIAVANARRIAAQGFLSHTNGPSVDLTCGLGHQAGENIGWYSGGSNDSWMNSKFMASPEHYANIMGPYHYVATAWVTTSDGRGWIAVEFG